MRRVILLRSPSSILYWTGSIYNGTSQGGKRQFCKYGRRQDMTGLGVSLPCRCVPQTRVRSHDQSIPGLTPVLGRVTNNEAVDSEAESCLSRIPPNHENMVRLVTLISVEYNIRNSLSVRDRKLIVEKSALDARDRVPRYQGANIDCSERYVTPEWVLSREHDGRSGPTDASDSRKRLSHLRGTELGRCCWQN